MDGKRSEEKNNDNLYTNIGDANDTYIAMSRNLNNNDNGEYLEVDDAQNIAFTTENLEIAAGQNDTADQDVDVSEPSYVPMSRSIYDDDYLEVLDAQNIAFNTTENLESASNQIETKDKKPWIGSTSPAIIISNPSTNFESQTEGRGSVRMKSSNPKRHIYSQASPQKEEEFSTVSNAESQNIYSYAAPDFMGQFPKAATLNLPSSGKSPSPSKSKPNTSLKERGDFDGKHNGSRAIASQLESKIFQRRTKDGVSNPATEKKFSKVKETKRRVDTQEINENENSVANSKKEMSPKDDCADYTEAFEKLKGSFERENDLSPSTSQIHLLDSLKSPSSSPRKKKNLSYEMKELANGKPSQKEDSFKKKITQSWRFRVHLGLLICMLLVSITIVTLQILGIFGEFSAKNEPMKPNPLLILTQKVKNMDDKINSRTKDINFLRRKLEYQETMIRNLQNVLKIYNMTNNLTTMDANTRVRRSKFRISDIDNAFLRLTKKDQELKFMAQKMNSQLKEKVDEIKMTPGPKGKRGEHGFYSFTRCRRGVKTSSVYAHHGSLDSFVMNVGIMLDTKDGRVMSIACSSQEASGSSYTSIPYADTRFYHKCICFKAKQAGDVRCHIIYYVCPMVD